MTASRVRLSQQIIRFAGVGALSTVLHLGLFAALVRGGAGPQVANGVALAVLGAVAPDAGTLVQTLVVAVANVLSTAARFVAMRRWIFRTPASPDDTTATPVGPTDRHDPAYSEGGVLESPQGER